MEIPVIPMSVEEYELSEHPLGWKMEYWNGEAHLTPREMGVRTRLDLTTFSPPQPQNSHPYTLVPVDETYAEQMIDGYFACFVNSVEFCNWPIENIQESAQRDITNYFAGKRGTPHSASVIALEPDTRKLAGLAQGPGRAGSFTVVVCAIAPSQKRYSHRHAPPRHWLSHSRKPTTAHHPLPHLQSSQPSVL